MITPSHIIYNLFILDDKKSKLFTTRSWAVLAGAIIPDTAMFVFFIVNGLVLGINHQTLWHDMYFNSAWRYAFIIGHSFLLWPFLLLLGHALKKTWLFWLSASALLHSGLDFLVHHDDAYRHFWPLSNWLWQSPISYWDRDYYGDIVGSIDSILILLLIFLLYKHYHNKIVKVALLALCALYTLSVMQIFIR